MAVPKAGGPVRGLLRKKPLGISGSGAMQKRLNPRRRANAMFALPSAQDGCPWHEPSAAAVAAKRSGRLCATDPRQFLAVPSTWPTNRHSNVSTAYGDDRLCGFLTPLTMAGTFFADIRKVEHAKTCCGHSVQRTLIVVKQAEH